jgi:NADH dehydrogenase FAD-containing subunit
VTDATMRVEGTTDTWAAGDCAAVPFPGGGTTPPLAIYAMMAGRQLGRNLRAVIRGPIAAAVSLHRAGVTPVRSAAATPWLT